MLEILENKRDNIIMAARKNITKKQIEDAIDDFANGKELKYIYSDLDIKRTMWRSKIKHFGLESQYAHARELYCDSLLDEIDDCIQQVKDGELDARSAAVIIDAYKWKLGKFYPKMFGDKSSVEVSGKNVQINFNIDKDSASEMKKIK